MYLRHEATIALPLSSPQALADGPISMRTTTVDPRLLIDGLRFAFLTQVCVPDAHLALTTGEDGEPAVRLSVPDGSWCEVSQRPTGGGHSLFEAGPTPVWARLEDAHAWWVQAGQPSWDRYGLTATPTDQYVWFDSPDSPRCWRLPT